MSVSAKKCYSGQKLSLPVFTEPIVGDLFLYLLNVCQCFDNQSTILLQQASLININQFNKFTQQNIRINETCFVNNYQQSIFKYSLICDWAGKSKIYQFYIYQQNKYNKQNPFSFNALLKYPLMQNNTQQPLMAQQINPYVETNYDLPVEKDFRQSFVPQANPLVEKQQSYHVKSLISNLILWIGVLAVVLVYFLDPNTTLSDTGVIWISVGIYLFYLILGMCCNPLFKYLGNIQHGGNFNKEYENVKTMLGYFVFHAECYHYQTRFHTRTVSDGNGGTRTQTYTTTEKVVTHVATENLHPKNTFDDSGSVDQVRALTQIIFVHYKVLYRFVDENSRRKFDYEWHNFQGRNRYDAHQNYSYNYNLPGLKQRMTFYIGIKQPKMGKYLYLFSFIGLLWPYSMFVQAKISRFDIQFMKILTL